MFYLTGIIVTFFLAALLISKKGKTAADQILVVWLVAMGIHLSTYYLFITGKNLAFPFLLGLELPLPLLHGPFLYLYTGTVTNQIKSRVKLLHFLPFLLTYTLLFQFMISPDEHKIFVYEHKGQGYESIQAFILVMIIISGIVYVALSLRLLAKHKQFISNQFSYADKINLTWLRYLIYGIGTIWIIVIFRDDTATYSAVVVFIIVLGYFGINQVGIFTEAIQFKPPLPAPLDFSFDSTQKVEVGNEKNQAKTKYLKSALSEVAAAEMHRALINVMREQKLYTNPELTLAELAETLNVHPNNLSQVINTFEQKSFYDYINLSRVEEFKRIVTLPESRKFNLLGLARACGFNSKTSFNRNFKNATGLSPTDYLKQAQISLE